MPQPSPRWGKKTAQLAVQICGSTSSHHSLPNSTFTEQSRPFHRVNPVNSQVGALTFVRRVRGLDAAGRLRSSALIGYLPDNCGERGLSPIRGSDSPVGSIFVNHWFCVAPEAGYGHSEDNCFGNLAVGGSELD